MSDNLTAVIIVVSVILGPIWIISNFLAKSRATRHLNGADAAALESMLAAQQKLEQRVDVLERILDAEVPGWRSHSATSYSRAL
jgi:phage shock protein B